MANRPAAFGLDAELAAKMAEKYDVQAEGEVRAFIKARTGHDLPSGANNLQAALKDGSILCELANALKPGSAANNKKTTMPFKQMENINKFLEVAKELGVPVSNLFQTVDLFENQNMGQVVLCINSLRLASEGKGKLVSTAHKEVKTDPTAISLQMGTNKGANASGQNFGLQRQIISK